MDGSHPPTCRTLSNTIGAVLRGAAPFALLLLGRTDDPLAAADKDIPADIAAANHCGAFQIIVIVSSSQWALSPADVWPDLPPVRGETQVWPEWSAARASHGQLRLRLAKLRRGGTVTRCPQPMNPGETS